MVQGWLSAALSVHESIFGSAGHLLRLPLTISGKDPLGRGFKAFEASGFSSHFSAQARVPVPDVWRKSPTLNGGRRRSRFHASQAGLRIMPGRDVTSRA